jgi:putative ABC transport system permease protein
VATSGLGRLAGLVDLEVADGDPVRGQADGAGLTGDGAPDGALLSVGAARDLGVEVGDRLTLRSTSGRETPVTVVATYRNTGFAGPAVVSRAAAEAADAEGTFELAALDVAAGAPTRLVAAQARRVADAFPKVRVHTPREFAELNTEVTDTVLRVIGVLLAGSVGIGFLGLGSTQALATLERRRELVMLRAVGALRAQVRALIGVEAAAVAAVSAVMGLAAGTALGWFGARFVPEDLVAAPVVPWGVLVAVGLAAVGIAALASLVVSRGATRLPPAEAGRTE